MKSCILMILLNCFSWIAVYAQENIRVFQGIVFIKQQAAEIQGDSVYWAMDVYIQGIEMGRRQSLTLTPVISHAGDSITLSPIVLYGTDKYTVYRREQVLNKRETFSSLTVLENDPKTLKSLSCKETFPYREWMSHASFKLIGTWEKHNGKKEGVIVDVLQEDLQLIPKKE